MFIRIFVLVLFWTHAQTAAYGQEFTQFSTDENHGFFPYKSSYVGISDFESNGAKDSELKFQFSIKYQFVRDFNLFFGYTQKSYWSIFKDSAPFRETNFSPELFWQQQLDTYEWLPFVQYGIYQHESTGEAGLGSHGWDRTYIEPVFKLDEQVSIIPKLWVPSILQGFNENKAAPDNPDIFKYYGYGDITVKHAFSVYNSYSAHFSYAPVDNSISWSLRFILSPNSLFPSEEKAYDSWGKFSNVDFFLELQNGYGYSLKSYNVKTSSVVFGINLVSL